MAVYPNGRYATLTAGRKFGPGAGLESCNQISGERMNPGLGQFAATASGPDGYGIRALISARVPGGLSASATGSGTAGGPAILALNALATLAGSGNLTALGGLIVNLAATIGGSGGISAATMQAFLNLVATITGAGGITATASGIGNAAATLTGAGAATGTATGRGNMAATLRGYGDLTPEGLRDAVWQAIAASNNAPGTMGAKLNAAASGGVDYMAMAEAVRAELAAELARLDAAISSRQASGAVVDADVRYVNGVEIGGTGTPGDTWGPA